MKVWAVVQEIAHEGGTLLGVFSSGTLADTYAKECELRSTFNF